MKKIHKRKLTKDKHSTRHNSQILQVLSIWFLSIICILGFGIWNVPKADAAAGINKQINFQGKLTNADGTNVTDGSYSVVFSLYNVSSGGTATWTETDNVTTSNGIFQVALGAGTALPGSVDFNTDTWYLGIKVGSDAEMTPRVRFTAVPYAFNASAVNGLTFSGTSGNTYSLPSTNNGTILTSNAPSQSITSTQSSGAVLGISDSTAETAAMTGLSITLSGSGAFDQTGLQFNLSNATGSNLNDIVGTGNNWHITRAGALTVASCNGCNGLATGGLAQVPLSNTPGATGANVVAPTGAGIVGMTINSTSNSSTTADALDVNAIPATGLTTTNGILVQQNSTGTTSNGIQIKQTSGTLTNGLTFSGTMTNLINATNFTVTSAGNVTAKGTLTAGSGNIQLTTSTGALNLMSGVGTGSISSGSGLESTANGLGLLQGCTNNQILEWNEASSLWECTDSGNANKQYFAKSADQSVTNSTVLTDETALQFTMGPGETWIFQYYLVASNNNSATPDWKAAINAATAASCDVTQSGTEPAGAAFPQAHSTNCTTPTTLVDSVVSADANIPFQVYIQGAVTDNGTGGTVKLQFAENTSGSGTSITIKKGSYVVAYKATGADLAEVYNTNDTSIAPGDVVALDSSLDAGVKKASRPYDPTALGIVSTQPGLILADNRNNTATPVFLALSGRVPVKVSTENGSIKPGDFLTSSSIPGVAMRATKAGAIVGQALTGFDADGVGSVIAFVKNSFSQGASAASLLPGLTDDEIKSTDAGINILEGLVQDQNSLTQTTPLSELTTDRLTAGLQIVSPSIVTKALTADTITANTIKANHIEGLEVFTDKLGTLAEAVDSLSSGSAMQENALMSSTSAEMVPLSGIGIRSLTVDKDATVSGDFRVKGSSFIEGILHVVDTIMANNLVVNGLTDLFGQVVFHNDTTFQKPPTFSPETGGFAVIHKNADSVAITFANPYSVPPVINATVVSVTTPNDLQPTIPASDYSFVITNASAKGFTIQLNKKAADDVSFSWSALHIATPTTFESQVVITPEPTGAVASGSAQ